MMRNVIRSFVAGIAALLLAQGSAVGATIFNGDIDEMLAPIGSGDSRPFTPNPSTHDDPLSFTDYYLFDVTETVDALTLASGFSSGPPPALLDPADFDLTLYYLVQPTELGSISGLDLDDILEAQQKGNGDGFGLFVSGLIAGTYVLQVAYQGAVSGNLYGGEITATPLPPALLIFGTGLFGLGFLSRYRRKRQGQLGLQV